MHTHAQQQQQQQQPTTNNNKQTTNNQQQPTTNNQQPTKWKLNTQTNKIGTQARNSVPRNTKEGDIKPFLIELMKNSTPWHSMKLVVLGNGRIGKTTLLDTMLQLLKSSKINVNKVCDRNSKKIKLCYNINCQAVLTYLIIQQEIKSTIGIDCSQISLAGGEVSIWDFGGQMEYTATHQFFLSSEACLQLPHIIYSFYWQTHLQMVVYIVCFDLEQNPQDQINQIAFWLQFLNSALPKFLPSSTVMIAGLKSDVKHPKISVSRDHIKTWKNLYNLPLFESDLFKQMNDNSSSSCPLFISSTLPSCDLDEFGKKLAFRYFHSTGHVVLLDDDTVCINPTIIPKIAAKFISPDDVRFRLLANNDVTFLNEC
jgi:hypothetical protein